MKAHKDNRSGHLQIVSVHVAADRIGDLRDVSALSAMGIRLEDAVAPWQEVVAAAGTRAHGRSATAWRRLAQTG